VLGKCKLTTWDILLIDVVFCVSKYINNKFTTHNSTNPYRIGLY
jgi:hypothetical protein